MPLHLVLLVLAIIFLGTFIQSSIGFGSALVAMPLLAPLIGFPTATPIVGLCGFTVGAVVLLMDHRSVDVRAAWRLILASFFGIPIGLLFLKWAPEHIVKDVMGVLLIAYALYSLVMDVRGRARGRNMQPIAVHQPRNGLAYGLGFVSGILGGAYNTNGPPLVIYGTLQGWAPEQFRATLQGAFFFANILILGGHALAGLWTPQVWRLFLYGLPAILIAIFLGRALNTRVPRRLFTRMIYAVLMALGVVFILQA